jgi:phosphoglycolate phosphatase
MTPAPGHTLASLITRTRCLLIDFDGPICDIYAGLTDAAVAEHLRKVIASRGSTDFPGPVASSHDPIAIFDYATTISAELGALVEAEMTSQETTATATARPVPYVHEVITSARETGRAIAVVSNNSGRAVRTYLDHHGLADRIDYVSARTIPDPALLKPSPYLISQAITALSAEPSGCVIIGDSITDVQAARLAGIASIGYANKPGKHDAFTTAGATAVVASLADLVLPLRSRYLPGNL